MAKLPWMQFYPADYLLDTQLLSPASRGIWMDVICHLWRSETRGTMTLSREHWARLLRCTVKEFSHALDELQSQQICNAVTLSNNDVTLSSRRLVKEEKRRRGAAMRVSRHRKKRDCNAPVTGENQKSESEVIYQNQKSESEEEREEKKEKSCGQVRTLPAALPKSAAVWEAYAGAYAGRYGVAPVRNAKTNAQLCQLVDRLGAEEAPLVAAYYLSHNKPLYVSSRHPVNLLVQDAEGLRTQWATGVKSTTREAQSAEQRDNVVSQVERVRAQLQGGR